MSHNFLSKSLASEIKPPVDVVHSKRNIQHFQRVEAVVKDDDMWKELQQELAKSGAISGAAVQEITRKFLLRKEGEIDLQVKSQDIKHKTRNLSPRRHSNDLDYSRRSSLSFIAERSKDFRRAFSMKNGEEGAMYSKRPTKIHDILNQSLSKINDTVSNLGLERSFNLEGGETFGIINPRMKNHSLYSGETMETGELTSISTACSNRGFSLNFSREALECNLELDDENSFCDSNYDDAELLVEFPSEFRSKVRGSGSDAAARMA
jgi:hypothetical protein